MKEQYKASFGAVKSIDIKTSSMFKPGKSKNWTIKTPTELKVKPKLWVWSNEY